MVIFICQKRSEKKINTKNFMSYKRLEKIVKMEMKYKGYVYRELHMCPVFIVYIKNRIL